MLPKIRSILEGELTLILSRARPTSVDAPRTTTPARRSRFAPAPEDAVWPTLRNYPYAA